ncbi:MAG: hypothetical protein IAE78_28925 [Myxococcus sp.]|nr:hypothetical protein [Myxococcus sp.]
MSPSHPFGSSSAPVSPELELRLQQALSTELDQPVKHWGRDAARFAAVTVALFGVGAVVFNGGLSPLNVSGAVWGQSLALLAVALVAGVAAMAPWPQRTSRPLVLGALLGGTVLLTQVVSMELTPLRPNFGCLAWELVCSLVPAGVALLAARQHAPRLSRALVLGWAAGTMSLAVMQLKCPHRDVGHVLLFHLAPLGLVVAATMLARRRLPTTSYTP